MAAAATAELSSLEMISRPERALRDDPLLRRVWDDLGRPSCCRITGGYVRDRLLGRPCTDLDLTLEGDVEDAAAPAARLARTLGVRAHLLGTPPHRIWRIETTELKVELWPLGGLTLEDDIRRRDFTVNAVSWQLPEGPLVDLVGGLDDLHGGLLRSISRANLEDDPVRLLRAPRFLAQLRELALDDATRDRIRELAPRLTHAPRERVGQELLALLGGPAAARGLAACIDLDLVGPVAPDPRRLDERWLEDNLRAIDRLNERLRAGGTPVPQWADTARLAFLIRAWGVPTDRELAPSAWPRFVREQAGRAASLLDQARSTVHAPAADRRELAWFAGAAFPALHALAQAIEPNRRAWQRWWRQWRRDPEVLRDPRPLLSGDDIAEITGLDPGPELGEAVDALIRAQVRGELRSRGGAVAWLRRRA